MKERNLTDLEECVQKIEALLKEYNCQIVVDRELGGSCILVDKDVGKFDYLPHINEFTQEPK